MKILLLAVMSFIILLPSVFSQEPWGQLLIPGVEPVSDGDRLKLRARMPLRPRRPQQSLPAAGLFGG